ncbi:N-terminal phage integrase SAM-like domain-containing protein [Bifidobacterium longum]|uniref:N-terminal phage integrase SAM-like domain-containing protein n=1 Tax=Bifidobacterium longum TaxID=216816 RepID=UPI001F60A57C|nr:N-terminal phage integrase SAM-like domain-containing protein [Bifidobacterium longum]
MLLREFWTNRFWPYCTRNLRESTLVGYESAWRLHVKPVFGAMQMDAINVGTGRQVACRVRFGGCRTQGMVCITRDTAQSDTLEPFGRGHHTA